MNGKNHPILNSINPVQEISHKILDDLSGLAKKSVRKRQHLNLHLSFEDPLQRYLNALEPGTYIRPHNHADSGNAEMVMIVRGTALVVIFDDAGNVIKRVVLSEKTDLWGIEFQPDDWHSMTALEPDTICFAIKKGPFNEKLAKTPAHWAPEENSPEAETYLQGVIIGE